MCLGVCHNLCHLNCNNIIGHPKFWARIPNGEKAQPAPAKPSDLPGVRILPGAKDGYMQLPNQWSLRPAGFHVLVGDLPVQALIHPSGNYLAVLHAGYGAHELAILSTGKNPKIISRTTLPHAFYGIAWADEGKTLLVSGGEYATVEEYPFSEGFLAKAKVITVAPQNPTLSPRVWRWMKIGFCGGFLESFGEYCLPQGSSKSPTG